MSNPARHEAYGVFFPGNHARTKILEFSRREAGWNFGDGDAFAPEVVKGALAISREADRLGLNESDAFPGNGGDVEVVFYDLPYAHSFIVNSDLSVDYTYERGVNNLCKTEFDTIDEALTKVGQIAADMCSPYILSTTQTAETWHSVSLCISHAACY